MPQDVKQGYDKDLLLLLYNEVQELKKVKANRSGDIIKGDFLVEGNLLTKGKSPGEDKIGQLYFGIDTEYPENVLPFNGAIKLRASYPELWDKVNAGKLGSLVTDSVWLTPSSLACGHFSSGDGSTTFRLPDWQGIFPRFAGANGVLKTANGSAYTGGELLEVLLDRFLSHEHVLPAHNGYDGGRNLHYKDGNKVAGRPELTNQSWNVLTTIYTAGSVVPRTGTETAPVSGSKYAFIFVGD